MALTEQELDMLIRERAIRLLVLSNGNRIWEAAPSPLHQMIIDEIRASIKPLAAQSGEKCDCYHLADVYIRLPDGSLVRPDVSIFCTPPPRQRQALTLVPAAIIEVISPGYETKDLGDLPPIYLANGVRDVLVVNTDQRQVTHFRSTGPVMHALPLSIDLECGCSCTLAG
ncbi:MAG: Uma2 family endonuclease [Chloroflexaceae bacterium]|nr:Uma2 family endonuclease [Chloroflexaceae bacterium]NJL33260.1 Uma2 family endonuclease [Chloroflexaceae bacterium]NJO05330.1 Uma2 family endonuclease [Chloroflexaceae bacterium]